MNHRFWSRLDLKLDMTKFIIIHLYEQISFLKDELTFIKAGSLSKNGIIGRLLTERSIAQKRNTRFNPTLLDSSSWLEKLMTKPTSSFKDSVSPGKNTIHMTTESMLNDINDVRAHSQVLQLTAEPVSIKSQQCKDIKDQRKSCSCEKEI